MSTNKPSAGSVVLKIPLVVLKIKFKMLFTVWQAAYKAQEYILLNSFKVVCMVITTPATDIKDASCL